MAAEPEAPETCAHCADAVYKFGAGGTPLCHRHWQQKFSEGRRVMELIAYPADSTERRRLFPQRDHGAKANLFLLRDILARFTRPGDCVLDPMAGVGSLLIGGTMGRRVVCVELEPDHARACRVNAAALRAAGLTDAPVHVLRGNALALALPSGSVDAIVTSPAYGNVATRRRNAEPSTHTRASVPAWVRKRTDAAFHVDAYGRTPGQLGNLRDALYLAAMAQVYAECRRVLKPGGVLVVITADYWRNHQRVDLKGRTAALCTGAGFVHDIAASWQRDRSQRLTTWQHLRRSQGLPVVLEEDIQVFRSPGDHRHDD
jgi:SAM-dependent methyltransferase